MVSLLQLKRTKSVNIQEVLGLLEDYKEYYQEVAKSHASLKNHPRLFHRKEILDSRYRRLHMSLPVRNWLEKELEKEVQAAFDDLCRSGSMECTTTTRDSWDRMSQHSLFSMKPST